MKKILVFISLLLFTNQTILAWHSSSRVPGKIIYNATDEDKRMIAIGDASFTDISNPIIMVFVLPCTLHLRIYKCLSYPLHNCFHLYLS